MFTVGFALHSKKAQRYLTDTVITLAKEYGLDIREIDREIPLVAQGPFHLILHKCNSDSEWEAELMEYSDAHPEVIIVDPLPRVNLLRNRATMLSTIPSALVKDSSLICPSLRQPLSWSGLRDRFVCSVDETRVFVPRQIELSEGVSPQEVKLKMAELQMTWPLLLKPKWADGRPGSHMLGFVRNLDGLEKALGPQGNYMPPPFIAQQIIPHDGIIYKVYVVGERVICSVRPSLQLSKCRESFQLLPRISSKVRNEITAERALPPEELTTALAFSLKKTLKLRLFNFDLIRHSEQESVYFVVDINYFPGIDKIDKFEELFVEFLFKTCERNS